MQFNDASTNQGICQEIDSLCDSTPTSYPIAVKTRRVNSALETLVGKIISADGTWQFDDTNFTNLPIGIADLVEGQSSYTFADKFLDIETVKIKDQNGHWHIIDPTDQSQEDTALEEQGLVKAFPIKYDKNADSIRLIPPPTSTVVTLTGGFKVEFKRTASLFTAADTTKEPGFASPFHILLAYMAAIPYCQAYKKDRVALYEKKITDITKDMINFYSLRERDARKVLGMKPIAFR